MASGFGGGAKKTGLFSEQEGAHHGASDDHNDADNHADDQADGFLRLFFDFWFGCSVSHGIPLNLLSSIAFFGREQTL